MKDSNNNSSNEVIHSQDDTIGQVPRNIFAKHSFHLARNISSFKELYGQETTFSDGKKIKSFPHLLGLNEDEIKVIPYDNSDKLSQDKLIQLMGKRRVLISIKHHATSPQESESLKFQCTHAQLVVRSGKKVMTFNNPQGYEGGLFGSVDYPMTFFSIKYPESCTENDIEEYENNIILWCTLLNTYSKFPNDYDGGDPLSAKTKEDAINFGKKSLLALDGDQDAKSWFSKEENKLYCAELVFMSLTLGVTFPLNEKNLTKEENKLLVNQISSKDYLNYNSNPFVKEVDLLQPSSELKALSSNGESNYFGKDLAIRPMLVSDMLTAYIKYTVDRKAIGEESGKYQYELFKVTQRFLNGHFPTSAFEEGTKLMSLIKELENVLLTNHGTYNQFKSKLKPLLLKIDKEVTKYSSASNTFIPPHCFLIRALELQREGKQKGILGIEYFGHGVHKSLL